MPDCDCPYCQQKLLDLDPVIGRLLREFGDEPVTEAEIVASADRAHAVARESE